MNDQIDNLTMNAERARNQLSELIDNLLDQVAPGELLHQLVSHQTWKEVGDVGVALGAQLKRNPLACLLIAAGVGWLIYSESAHWQPPAPRKRAVARRGPAKKRVRMRRRRRRTALANRNPPAQLPISESADGFRPSASTDPTNALLPATLEGDAQERAAG